MANHDCKQETFINKIDDKLDKTNEILREISVTLGENTVSLKEHMRRTELLEKAMENTNNSIKPLKNIYVFCKYLIKFGAILGAITGFVIGLIKFFA